MKWMPRGKWSLFFNSRFSVPSVKLNNPKTLGCHRSNGLCSSEALKTNMKCSRRTWNSAGNKCCLKDLICHHQSQDNTLLGCFKLNPLLARCILESLMLPNEASGMLNSCPALEFVVTNLFTLSKIPTLQCQRAHSSQHPLKVKQSDFPYSFALGLAFKHYYVPVSIFCSITKFNLLPVGIMLVYSPLRFWCLSFMESKLSFDGFACYKTKGWMARRRNMPTTWIWLFFLDIQKTYYLLLLSSRRSW